MILFFKPIPRYTIWGGKTCNNYFNTSDIFEDGVGQLWAFSAQKEDSTVCTSAPFEGKTLLELWQDNPGLFGNHAGEDFPLIISLVAPEDDLSLQVHPDSDYAGKKLGLSMGKNEAWYFISTDNSSIVYGQNAGSREELESLIAQDRWDDIPVTVPMHDGDFVYIPAGFMHAMGKNNIVYEIQQSTDVTYRFYDYKRKDKNGNERKLDLQEALDCIHFEENPVLPEPEIVHCEGFTLTEFIRNSSFTVTRLEAIGRAEYKTEVYQLATVVKGEGFADGCPVKPGSSFLIPVGECVLLEGSMTLMMTTKENI